MRRRFLTCLFSTPCLMLIGNASASVVISDDPGTSANWQEVADPNYPAAGLYVLNCGNSCVNYQAGGFNFIEFSYGGNLSGVVWGTGNEYTPTAITPSSEGAVSGMNLSVQGRNGSYDGTEIAFLLIQNGNYYRTAFDVLPVGNASEMTYSLSGLTASSFGEFVGMAYGYSDPNSISGQDDGSADFTKNPDFSATAAPITIGYLAAYNSSFNTSPPDGAAYNGVNQFDATVNFGAAAGSSPAWLNDSPGDWNVASNWSTSTVPNGAGVEADLLGAISTAHTIFTEIPITVGTLHFNNANTYEITGVGNLTIQTTASSVPGLVQVDQGTQEIDLPLTFASDAVLNVASGATLLLANPVTVNAGVDVSQSGDGTVTYQSIVTVQSGGSLAFANSTIGNALSLQSNASASISADSKSVVQFNTLSIASGATLDVGDGTLVVNYGGNSDPAATIRSELVSGFNATGAKWTGPGINSSVAASNPISFAVGYADGGNAIDRANTGILPGEVEIKYTVAGDANLSGSVDLSDLVIIASDFGMNGADWAAGDLNYDGNVDLSDLVIVASNFGASSNSIESGDFSSAFAAEWKLAQAEARGDDVSVPEPASIVLLSSTGLCLIRRRRHFAKSEKCAQG